MVRFVGKGHLNDQNPFFGQILVRHLVEKLAFSEFSTFNFFIFSCILEILQINLSLVVYLRGFACI